MTSATSDQMPRRRSGLDSDFAVESPVRLRAAELEQLLEWLNNRGRNCGTSSCSEPG